MKFIVHTDGGARGNPGPAAIGVLIEMTNEKKKIVEISKKIEEATNNVAEYTAVLEALRNIKYQISNIKYEERKQMQIAFFLDSVLVVNQLNGKFKVKDPQLRELLLAVRLLEQEVGGLIRYAAVPREQNQWADFLVNKALDGDKLMSLSSFAK